MTSLCEESGYNKLERHFQENKHRELSEWLEVEELFTKSGKQGNLGILRSRKEPEIRYVFKFSQYTDYLARHEYTVTKSLNNVGKYCPHFCKTIGIIKTKINPRFRKENKSPFDNCKNAIETEVLLMEVISESHKLYSYIKNSESDDVIYSAIKQTLMATAIAQKTCKFTHYDLHSNNVLVRRCNPNVVFLYVFDEQNQYCVPSHGIYTTIIDYGFSYSDGMDGDYLWSSLAHTKIGFNSDRFDAFADPKLFLITVSGEMEDFGKNRKTRKLSNITYNIFENLRVDWSCGWDEYVKKAAADYIEEVIYKCNIGLGDGNSRIFREITYYCIDIIDTLIKLPLSKESYKDIKQSFLLFLKEFVKIENQIGSDYYAVYMLKCVVDCAREVAFDYVSKTRRGGAVERFKNLVFEKVDTVAKFCTLRGVNFEKLLCGLICFSRCMEGVYYEVMQKQVARKERDYEKLPLKSVEQMYAAIEINIPDTYRYCVGTKVCVIDVVRSDCGWVELSDEIVERLNSVVSVSRGRELYKFLTCVDEEERNELSSDIYRYMVEDVNFENEVVGPSLSPVSEKADEVVCQKVEETGEVL
jgi:hypothetical protein